MSNDQFIPAPAARRQGGVADPGHWNSTIVSMPRSMTEWFEECMDEAGHKYNVHGRGILLGQPVKLYVVQNMTIKEIHLLLKTYIQTSVNAHQIQASL
jgi:hypothetical protein